MPVGYVRGDPARSACLYAPSRACLRRVIFGIPRSREARGNAEEADTIVRSRRSGRVAEGGALLRRYGDECLHRGFESLLLRWRGGRAVECGGLENRYPSLGGSRVQISPPPLPRAGTR